MSGFGGRGSWGSGTRAIFFSGAACQCCCIACSPCLSAYNHRLTFCDGDNQCLKRIPPDPVLADALAALAQGDRALA
jgi:hypothetical protein